MLLIRKFIPETVKKQFEEEMTCRFEEFFKHLSSRINNIFLQNAVKIFVEKTNNAGLYESEQEQVDAYFRL